MALVLADQGADVVLNAYFNNTWPASKNLSMKLYTNDYTPLQTSTTASFTSASGGGYAHIALLSGSWTVTPANDPSDATYAEQTYTFTGALDGSATVYGYYVVANAGNGDLVWGERFATSFQPANNGDTIKITPRFQMSSGTPA
jgi:hypothetical protein